MWNTPTKEELAKIPRLYETEGVAEDARELESELQSVHIDHILINQLPIRALMASNMINPNKIKMTSTGGRLFGRDRLFW